MPDSWLATVLDAGEAATIALALRENPKFVLIDERDGPEQGCFSAAGLEICLRFDFESFRLYQARL